MSRELPPLKGALPPERAMDDTNRVAPEIVDEAEKKDLINTKINEDDEVNADDAININASKLTE